MPDPNKLKVLGDVAYYLLLGCGECKHGRFSPHSSFGACQLHEYVHVKHGPPARKLSVHRSGRCPKFEPNAKKLADVQRSGFERFLVPGAKESE